MRDAIEWVLRIITSYHDIPWTTDPANERLGEFVDLPLPKSELPCGCTDVLPVFRVWHRTGLVHHTGCGGGITCLPLWVLDPEESALIEANVEQALEELRRVPGGIQWRLPARGRSRGEYVEILIEEPSPRPIPPIIRRGDRVRNQYRIWRKTGLVTDGRQVGQLDLHIFADLPRL